MQQEPTAHIPPKERFSLPEVLDLLKPLGCTQMDLFEYLRSGQLQAVCYPYRLGLDREVQIEPDEWPAWFREPWEFPIYADHIGEMDIAEHQTPIPLHIVPRATKADTLLDLAAVRCDDRDWHRARAAADAVVNIQKFGGTELTKVSILVGHHLTKSAIGFVATEGQLRRAFFRQWLGRWQ